MKWLRLLRKHKLYAKMSKCKFVKPELQFLGHIIGVNGLRVDPKKVAIVKEWPVPQTRLELQQFHGLANYFRKFVLGYTKLVEPLQQLLKRDRQYVWTEECDAAFTGLKDALCNAPVLALPDFQKPFEVICDACGVGLGAVLLQDGRPLAFEGKRLTSAEQNYDVGEQEMLAVVHALELWRCYLDGTEFTVVTDHSPNTFFANKKLLSPRQRRWAERLSPFKFVWEYRPGRTNVADPISRHPTFFAESSTVAAVLNAVCTDLPVNLAAIVASVSAVSTRAKPARAKVAQDTAETPLPPANDNAEAENAVAEQQDLDMLSEIIQGYHTDPWFSNEHNRADLELYNGLYYKGDALVIPDVQKLKVAILKELHDANYSGHVGYHRTQHNVQRHYWWPGMTVDIRTYVQGCQVCQRDKASHKHPAGKLMPLEIPKEQWDCATMDRIVQLPKTKRGNTAILFIVDKLTKMTHFAPLTTNATAADVAQAFVE